MVKFLHPIYKRIKSVGASPEHQAFLESIDNQLKDLDDDLKSMVSEMQIKKASGGWLNAWGDWYGVERENNMSDDEYREHILTEVTKPRNTIPGIVDEIKRHLPEGSEVWVHEPYVDIFRFNISEMSMTDRIQDDEYTRHNVIDIIIDGPLPPYLADIVESVKAAGVKIYFTRDSPIYGEDEDGNLIHVRMYSLVEPEPHYFKTTQLEIEPLDILNFNEGEFNRDGHYMSGRQLIFMEHHRTTEIKALAKRLITTSRNTSLESLIDQSMDQEWYHDFFDAVQVERTIFTIMDDKFSHSIKVEPYTQTSTTGYNKHTPFIIADSAIPVEQYYDTPVGDMYDHGDQSSLEDISDKPVQNGLQLWYEFGGKSNTDSDNEIIEDLSGNGNHGTLQNFAFTGDSGYSGGGLKFDGIDDVIIVPDVEVEDFTLTMNIKVDTAENQFFTQFGNSAQFYLRKNLGHRLHGSVSTAGGQQTMSVSNVFNTDSETHVSVGFMVDSARGKLSLLVDGEIADESDISQPDTAVLSALGRWMASDDRVLSGTLYSTTFYNRALTPVEIQHNYEVDKEAHLKRGLVLNYDFSMKSNTHFNREVATDLSGNGNHGTLQNFAYSGGSGYQDGGLKFDGVDDYVGDVNNNMLGDTSGVIYDTLSFTVKANEDKRNNLLYASEDLKIDVYGTNIRRADVSPNLVIDIDTMTKPINVSYVRHSEGIKVYVDGELVEDAAYNPSDFKELALYNVGFYVLYGRPNVDLYGVKIYNRPLTAEEIQQNYQIEKARHGLP